MKGRSAVQALIDQGYPADHIVVVDSNGANIKAATGDGCVGVLGDARREDVLRQAAVPNAHRIIVAADRDDTSVLVTLTCRRLAPDATIAASAREEQNIEVLRQGGADVVIPTAESAGRLLGLAIIAPNAGEVIEDLLEPVAGLQISEREVRPEDVGLSPARLTARGEIVLTVIRNGVSHRFDSGGVKVFQPGDKIVVIRANAANPDPGSGRSRNRRPQEPDATAYPADLADALGVSRQSLSNHLTCLRGCGLVVAIPEGRRVRYELADGRLRHALTDLLGVVLAVDERFCAPDTRPAASSGSGVQPW